jgi:hypothetical protein
MPETVNWSATFDAVLGPRIAESGVLTVAAYDKISVELAGNAKDDVDLQPSGSAGDVQLLLIIANSYKAGVTFSADAGATKFTLDGPVMLIGAGPVALLADPPKTLQFNNPKADPVDIEIMVGRQV